MCLVALNQTFEIHVQISPSFYFFDHFCCNLPNAQCCEHFIEALEM